MARVARKESSSGIYHIMMRGNNKSPIFHCNEDKKFFRNILSKNIEKREVIPYAYAIMDNHIHLILKCDLPVLSDLIHVTAMIYGQYYNGTYQHVGHVFQDRYKSECIEDEQYFLNCIRYIHQNPVKAGMSEKSESYMYSSAWEYSRNGMIFSSTKPNKLYEFYFPSKEEFAIFNNKLVDSVILDYKEDQNMYAKELIRSYTRQYIEEHPVTQVRKTELLRYISRGTKLSQEQIKAAENQGT